MNKLTNGTQYRAVYNGYILKRGKREIYIIAKSYIQGVQAKKLIAEKSFNALFNMGKKIHTLGSNTSIITL